MAKTTSRLAVYYLSLFGVVMLTNVAIYFAITKLLGLPSTPSLRFLALCTFLMLAVAAPNVYRRVHTERSSVTRESIGPSGAGVMQALVIARSAGFFACAFLVTLSIYFFSTDSSTLGGAAAIVAAVVAVIASRVFPRSN